MTKLSHASCVKIPAIAKARVSFLFLAKHATGSGQPDPADGNHAIYHHELRTTLQQIGLNVVAADDFSAIMNGPSVDFVIPLLNHGGFQNSEMLAPLLLARCGIPHLGASAILRGLADDKHLTKMVARHHGVPTMDWEIYRRGQGAIAAPTFRADQLVVKPNASSASWGVRVVGSCSEAREHIDALHEAGHDVIVERHVPQLDVAVPVIGGNSPEPWLLPPMMYLPEDGNRLRSYEEKRALVESSVDPLVRVNDPVLIARLERHSRALIRELWPSDYGRLEYRYDPATDELLLMEVNLSCNLWSQKTISRSAGSIGVDHAMLVESIVAHSLRRQGLIDAAAAELAA